MSREEDQRHDVDERGGVDSFSIGSVMIWGPVRGRPEIQVEEIHDKLSHLLGILSSSFQWVANQDGQ